MMTAETREKDKRRPTIGRHKSMYRKTADERREEHQQTDGREWETEQRKTDRKKRQLKYRQKATPTFTANYIRTFACFGGAPYQMYNNNVPYSYTDINNVNVTIRPAQAFDLRITTGPTASKPPSETKHNTHRKILSPTHPSRFKPRAYSQPIGSPAQERAATAVSGCRKTTSPSIGSCRFHCTPFNSHVCGNSLLDERPRFRAIRTFLENARAQHSTAAVQPRHAAFFLPLTRYKKKHEYKPANSPLLN